MKGMSKFLGDNSSHLIFDIDQVVPYGIFRMTINSEIRKAQINSCTYWDHFNPDNIHRSNVLKAQIQKAKTEKNVSRRRLSCR